jgi:voltage-gated potassium channel|uniref:ion transporter n=1 Tax=Cephaloticoccus sp. TaxID=1985742 RepID=UPI00404A80FD
MTHPELKPFQAIILVLSIVAVGALAVELVFTVPAEAQRVMRWIDNIICVVLLIDFSIRFYRAESKLEFMKWGWIELLASIPEVEALRWGRLFRVFRILRIILITRSMRQYLTELFRNRTRGGVASVFLITFLVISFSSVSILLVERTPDANIRTAGDALWWSVTTITTVGYGDKYPMTDAGRIIAGFLMVTGVGLFGTLSGVIASFFLGHHHEQRKKEQLLMEHLEHLHAEIAELRGKAHHTKTDS